MNIMETTIVGDGEHFFFTFEDSNLKIQVPERYYNVVSNGFKCKMGVRPMDVMIGGEHSKGTPEEVATFENLGDERRIGIRVGKSLLMIITMMRQDIKPEILSNWKFVEKKHTCLILRPEIVSVNS